MGTCRGRAHVILVAANANGRVHCRRHRPCVGRRGLSPKARLIFVASPINTRFALLDIFCAASHPYAAISECACWRLRKIQLRAMQRDNATAEAEAVARFVPHGMTVKEAEVVLSKEWFRCGPFQDAGATEAARWGEKYRHYIICERTTYYHPFYMFGRKIELFANGEDVIESVRAIRWYEGL
jgi:hypothetical protein